MRLTPQNVTFGQNADISEEFDTFQEILTGMAHAKRAAKI